MSRMSMRRVVATKESIIMSFIFVLQGCSPGIGLMSSNGGANSQASQTSAKQVVYAVRNQTTCDGTANVVDNGLSYATQILQKGNVNVTLQEGYAVVKLTDPFNEGHFSTATTTYIVPPISGLASIEGYSKAQTGSPPPSTVLPPVLQRADTGLYANLTLTLECSPKATAGTTIAIVSQTGDTFVPPTVNCTPGATASVIAYRSSDPPPPLDFTVTKPQPFTGPMQLSLQSTAGTCSASIPVNVPPPLYQDSN
jgi:hypothetical protein